MLSLSNDFDEEDLVNFEKKINNFLDQKSSNELEYSAEPKIDGISASLIFKKGKFIMGLSRGDGKEGEDITQNLMTINDIPKNISAVNFPDEIDIRGEVFIQNKDFGESRITITNNALVNLSNEDKDRTIRESKIINKALQTYSKKMKPSFSFISPVDGIISSRYGKKRFINNSPRSPHLALDIAAPEGTKVLSPEDGKVILIGNFFYSGNYLIIDHGQGLLSSYSHLSSISVSEDDIVKQGQEIGKVGSTGRVTGPHLHWTVYYEKVRINPESLLKDNYLEALL